MMAATDFFQRVADRTKKVCIRRDDRSIELEFDHRLAPADCLHLPLGIDRLVLGVGDVGGKLDDARHAAGGILDRIV